MLAHVVFFFTLQSVVSFQQFAAERAKATNKYIDDWYSARLARDDSPAYVAVLCARSSGDNEAAFLIEKDGRRWAIPFEEQGGQNVCGKASTTTSLPPFRDSAERSILLSTSHHHGDEQMWFAIRNGVPVIVRTEELDDITESETPKIVDYDRRAKAGRGKYPAPERLIEVSPPALPAVPAQLDGDAAMSWSLSCAVVQPKAHFYGEDGKQRAAYVQQGDHVDAAAAPASIAAEYVRARFHGAKKDTIGLLKKSDLTCAAQGQVDRH